MKSLKNLKRNNTFTVLGIDPGLETTGWAFLKRKNLSENECLDFGTFDTTLKNSLPERLEMIFNNLSALIKTLRPDFIAMEEMFFFKRAKTVTATMQARGVILLAAQLNKVTTESFSPRQVKLAVTGSGAAGKTQVAKMVQLTLKLKSIPKPEDITDAMAIALCYVKTAPLKSKMKEMQERIAKAVSENKR